jgi:aminomethyltransferase
MSEVLLRTSLYPQHLAAGARMVPFAGWEMPVQYAGIMAEARAVREAVGMFDVSHMGRLTFTGQGVLPFLELVTSNDVSKLRDGAGQYSLLPNENGGCVDDIIVYRVSEAEYRMVVNAANHDKDWAWLQDHRPADVLIVDNTKQTAMIAVQGPLACETLGKLSNAAEALRDAPAFGIVNAEIAGVSCFAARSGYTGEDGFELVCSAEDSGKLWDALLAAGVTPCGLASRDTLRVEAGLPLYGHELTDELSPIAANLGWVVSKTKSFIGSDPINQARAEGTAQKLMGIRLDAKRLIPGGTKVFVGDREVGEVSSGVVSPTLDQAIAFAFVDRDISADTACNLELRGKMEPGRIVTKRFLKKS